jgi:PmbA protein
MTTASLMELAQQTAEALQRAGAADSRVRLYRSRNVEVEWRDGKLDRIRESTEQSLAAELYVDGRYSESSTSDLRPETLKRLCADWVAATRFLEADPHRKLPDPARYQGMTRADLQLDDPAVRAKTPASRRERARALEELVRQGEGRERIVSVTAWAGDTATESVLVASNGLAERRDHTSVNFGAQASVRDEGDRKPVGDGYTAARFDADLPPLGAVAAEALARALAQLGSKQETTGRYDLVIENRVVPRLLTHLLRALQGDAVQQRRSFLEGRLDQRVGAELLSVSDEPHLPRGLGSRAFDGEGMATTSRPIFAGGVLKTFFFDTYYGSKQGVAPTTGSVTNLGWKLGRRDGRGMLADVARGLYVTDFLGGNSNSTTGDFSLGIKGFLVEQGRLGHPVSEMNMAGNHLALWQSLAEVGNDPFLASALRTPSLRFTGVQCSGA